MAYLETIRRARPRYRRFERLAHAAVQHRLAHMGWRNPQTLQYSTRASAGCEGIEWRDRTDGNLRRKHSDRWDGWGPAGIAVWTSVLHARQREEYVWHRTVSADERGREDSAFGFRPGSDGRLVAQREDDLRARRQRLYCRGGAAMAAR